MSIMRSVFVLSLAASSAVAAPLLSRRNGAMMMNEAMTGLTSKATEAIEFGYEGNSGPNFWPDECQKTDPGQSPIDLREGSADKQDGALEADLPTQENCVLTNSGHDLRVALDPAAPKMSFVPAGQSDSFEVEGFHFHSPSEHHVNGRYFDAEMHMVGKSASGGTAVLAVFFEVSATPQEGNLIQLMAENFPLDGKEAPLPSVDFTSILEATNQLTGFHSYTGSLTTPPCTTGVLWSVMETPVPISVADVLAMRNELVFSARFTQVARDEEPVFTPPKKAGEGDEAPCDAGDVEVPAEEPAQELPAAEEPIAPATEAEVPCDTTPEAPVDPAAEVPIEPASEIPIEPAAEEPEQPCETPEPEAPVEPASEVPIEPAAEEPEQPCETPEPEAPVEPAAEVPIEPAAEEPEQPCETPEPEAPIEPAAEVPIEPAAEVPIEPAAEEPEQPCETPEPEAPVEPAGEVPVEPAAEEPCETPEPEAPTPVEPAAEEPPCDTPTPEVPTPVEPASEEPPCDTPTPEVPTPVEPAAEEPPCDTPTPEVPAPVEPAAEEPPCDTPTPEVPAPVEPAAEEPCETPAPDAPVEPAVEQPATPEAGKEMEMKKEESMPTPTY